MIDEADDKNVDIKPLAYATIGKLVSKVSSLVFDKVDIVSTLFSRLEVSSASHCVYIYIHVYI